MDAAQRADAGPSAGRTGTSTAHAGRKQEDSRPGPLERAVSARPTSKLPQRRLLGRRTECEVLERLVASIREGRSQALVLRGEAGVGKTALLDYVAESARGCLVVRAAGVESELELPFAGLHQLCAPFLDRLGRLPGPQRGALGAAFGLRDGDSPDRFLVSMAVLSLLSVVAETRPLLWVVDDVHWLDLASVQALAFAARRLAAEPVGLIFAARGLDAGLTGLTELMVEGLPEGDARTLLDSVRTGPLDERVRDQIVAETRGNPLALVELVRGLMPVELAGGFGLLGSVPLSGRIEESFRRRLSALPAPTQRLVQVAAADPTGDPVLVWRAGERLGIAAEEAAPAAEAGLVEFGARVVFRHPLVRSAAYQSASLAERQAAHRALAETTDPESDPDRRAWHRAQATPGPDEDVAAELEMSAARAQARGGLAAAAAFLERAAALTPEPARRVERLLAAARAKRDAGALDKALGLLALAEAGPRDALQTAKVEHLRGQIAMDKRCGRDGARLLLSAARQFAPLSADLARETYLEALGAAIWADDFGSPGKIREAAEAALTAPRRPSPPRLADVLLDAFAVRLTEGYTAAAPALTRALELVLALNRTDEASSWLWLASSRASGVITLELWDDAAAYNLATRLVQFARGAGALTQLQFALSYRARTLLLSGELATAALMIEEDHLIGEATGNKPVAYSAMTLAAWQGQEALATGMIEAAMQEATANYLGRLATYADYTSAVLYNGLGRHEAARDAAWRAFGRDFLGYGAFIVPELAEAASRTGDTAMVDAALEWLSERTRFRPTEWALGIEARLRALLSDGDAADGHYREALTQLGRTRVRAELARTHLLYGEWLRRQRRRTDARGQLRTAHDMLDAMGIEAFAARARRELRATGESVTKRTAGALTELTAQEAQVARLARDGLSNAEIGARLFISPATVAYHLRKVFTKLDISSRTQLDRALPSVQPR